MLRDDSPLRRLPSGLHRKQALFLDGISLSVDMTALAYQRLRKGLLWPLPTGKHHPSSRSGTAEIVMDAWSIIDSVNRLRVLVEGMRGLRRGSAVVSFLNSVSDVEALRNAVQHLSGEVEKLWEDGWPLWGTLSWVVVEAPDAEQFLTVAFNPGALGGRVRVPVVNPVGREVEIPVGLVHLTAAGVTLSLSDIVAAVERFTGRLERAADKAFASLPDSATDTYITLDLPVD
jgi:hypothetical protein